jgi:transcriptional regulator with XRE-family HTH domain
VKLSEKIQLLRKNNGYSQEKLAVECNVSRQAISKWEADIALPETEKLLILSRLFRVSIDVLLKDELEIDIAKEVSSCGNINYANYENNANGVYDGIIIKESIADELILNHVSINKVEIWNTNGTPKYWTAIYFTSSRLDFPEQVSKAVISNKGEGNWFVDMKSGNTKFIIFRNKVLKYVIGNSEEKDMVCEECRKLGIPNNQMNWEE